ncbi:hypothetical protein SNE40_002173 [Patella caerulea]|uniref:Uncharacterized protein n=1 Tax=Patella caerulea TaxID=87958 RepID=A0AAN8PYS8_PATCE
MIGAADLSCKLHKELAFDGALEAILNETKVEFISTEAGVLAEDSMIYNRCTRIHEPLANVTEQKAYDRHIQELLSAARQAAMEEI